MMMMMVIWWQRKLYVNEKSPSCSRQNVALTVRFFLKDRACIDLVILCSCVHACMHAFIHSFIHSLVEMTTLLNLQQTIRNLLCSTFCTSLSYISCWLPLQSWTSHKAFIPVPGSNQRCRQFLLFFTETTATRSFWYGVYIFCSV